MLSSIDNEFNLEPVHFNNSRALIAWLKGFRTILTQASVYQIYMSVCLQWKREICPLTWVKKWSCGIVETARFKKAVQFIYQSIETTTENFYFSTLDFFRVENAWTIAWNHWFKISNDINFGNAIYQIFSDDNFRAIYSDQRGIHPFLSLRKQK